ncbi:MAG: hypothetical protein HY765_04955, partial [Rhodomicrobium sp.]|nr:hypothetical protein [Rhodomicrobium sp.]
MLKTYKKPVANVILLAALLLTPASAAVAQNCQMPKKTQAQADSQAVNHNSMRECVNAGTVGFAAGALEGAPIRVASELARVL